MPQLKLVSAYSASARKDLDHIFLFGCSILIAEDEPLIALDLDAALCAVGAGIIAATDAAEALRLIRRNEISAAVIGVELGDLDALEVCQALFHRRVPFLFYTGHTHADLLKAWPEVPVSAKPARTSEVVACIANLNTLRSSIITSGIIILVMLSRRTFHRVGRVSALQCLRLL